MGCMMRQIANGLRKSPEAAIGNIAALPVGGDPPKANSRALPLELKDLVSPYRKHGRFTVRLEKLPQAARLSAGQNNGDHTWSLALDELEDLLYFPPPGLDHGHEVAIRIIVKDETGASTIALINHRIVGASDDENALRTLPQRGVRKSEPSEISDNVLSQENALLKSALAEKELALDRLRTASEQRDAHLAQRIEASLAEAEDVWRREEADRLQALEAELQGDFEHKLAELKLGAQADAKTSNAEMAALGKLQLELETVKSRLVDREAELTSLQAEFERLSQDKTAELFTATANAEAKIAVESERRKLAEKTLAEITTRYEAALASLRAASAINSHEDELKQLRAELGARRLEVETDSSAARAAAEAIASERLQAAQAQWQQDAANELIEITARCESAEAAMAAAESRIASCDDELHQLRSEVAARQKEIETVRTAADKRADERLQLAQAQWQQSAAKELAAVTARYESAEAAFIAECQTKQSAQDDVYVRRLNREIKTLQATLVDREAALAMVHAKLEELRFGARPENPSLPQVGRTTRPHADEENGHLLRDVVIVFAVVMVSVLAFPQVEAFLSDAPRQQDAGGERSTPHIATAPAEALNATVKYPIATVLRDVNMRALPSVSAQILTSLKPDTSVTILESRGNWNKVQVSGGGGARTGWLYRSYLAEAKK